MWIINPLAEVLEYVKYMIFKRFVVVILTKNTTQMSEATNKGIIYRNANCKRQNVRPHAMYIWYAHIILFLAIKVFICSLMMVVYWDQNM